MKEEFVIDSEYPRYFAVLNGLRRRIAENLPIEPSMRILDLATGYGYFAIETALRYPDTAVVGIDITRSGVANAADRISRQRLADRVKVLQMDATRLGLADNGFDAVINFLGLEDIHMTCGRDGVARTFAEASRVLRPNGHFCFVVMPPEQMETEAQRLEGSVFSYICGCKWLSLTQYCGELETHGFTSPATFAYRTGKKLTARQAREEIKFACENVPVTYGVAAASFEEAWERYGKSIEKHGLGHYSKVVLFLSKKSPGAVIRS